MTLPRGLRLIAVLIALAGAADPSWSRTVSVPRSLRIGVIDRPTFDLPAAGGTRRAEAFAAAARLRDLLGADYDVEIRTLSDPALAVCPETGACVVVADGLVANPMPPGATLLGGVALDTALSPNVSIVGVDLPRTSGVNAAATVRVHLRATDIRGDSTVEVSDGGIVVGAAARTWEGQSGAQDAVVDVPWVPIAEGPRRLRISASVISGERSGLDNTVDVAADVRTERVPILFHESEASWLGTFVRRALEDDGRFALAGGTRLAPSVLVTRGAARGLTEAALSGVRVAVVAAPHALGQGDVGLLERFARDRGGAVLLLLDRRPDGAVTRLLPPIGAERQLTKAQAVGPLQITDAQTFIVNSPAVKTLATLDGQPVIVSRALGHGHVISSGALDAWRARSDGRFAAFWSGLVSDAALAVGPDVAVVVEPALARPGERVRVTMRRRPGVTESSGLTARAALRCGDETSPLRLWPEAQPGVFSATVVAAGEGRCTIDASLDDVDRGTASLLIASDAIPVRAEGAALATTVAAYGGTLVPRGDEETLAAAVRRALPAERQPRPAHPMRSAWWLVPFCACLAGEWWLRRRSGAR
jgi:hypothetical protein